MRVTRIAGRTTPAAQPTGKEQAPKIAHPAPQHPLAAVELIIGHRVFLHRGDFTQHITIGEYGPYDGKAVHAAIDWTAATAALHANNLPCSSGERRILCIASSLPPGSR
jgi:hypothetical protein